jgi:hypothetical protein
MTVKFSEERDLKTIESALMEAQELAEQEFYRIQVLGRELTQEEKKRSEVLETCLGYIREALTTLKQS